MHRDVANSAPPWLDGPVAELLTKAQPEMLTANNGPMPTYTAAEKPRLFTKVHASSAARAAVTTRTVTAAP